MLEWLSPSYNVIEVIHDGTLFEYPALRYMQQFCVETGKPCLYIHTRGAFHQWNTTIPTRRLWRHEFAELRDKYLELVSVDAPTVACPFTGSKKKTWHNGFMANASAMSAIPDIVISSDRLYYEHLFEGSDVNVIGTIIDNDNELKVVRNYILTNYR